MTEQTFSSTERGLWGETLAMQALEAHGYEIIQRNWRVATGEIDIVSQEGSPITFKEDAFFRLFFGQMHGQAIQQIFSEGGTDTTKLSNLLKKYPDGKVGIYPEKYLLIAHDKESKILVVPIGRGVAKRIMGVLGRQTQEAHGIRRKA